MKAVILLILLISIFSFGEEITIKSIEDIQFSNIIKSHNKELFTAAELQQIAEPSKIREFILIRAVTSAPANIDVVNILKRLKGSEIIDDLAPALTSRVEDAIWEAIIITDADSYHIAISKEKTYIASSKKYAYLRRM